MTTVFCVLQQSETMRTNKKCLKNEATQPTNFLITIMNHDIDALNKHLYTTMLVVITNVKVNETKY